jgi:phage-related protein
VNNNTVKLSRQDLVKCMLVFMVRHGCWNKGRWTAPAHITITILLSRRNTHNFVAWH